MCVWHNKEITILDVPEDKPIVAYKYLSPTYYDSNVLASPHRMGVVWKPGKIVKSKASFRKGYDPLVTPNGDKIGIFAFASKTAADQHIRKSGALTKRLVVVKVHLWGKVAVHLGERSRPYPSYCRRRFGTTLRSIPVTGDGRYKGYRAQYAKLVKVY